MRVIEARLLLDDAAVNPRSEPVLYGSDEVAVAAAQVLATLEVAEQLRMANVLAVAGMQFADGSRPFGHLVASPVGSVGVGLARNVQEVLGL